MIMDSKQLDMRLLTVPAVLYPPSIYYDPNEQGPGNRKKAASSCDEKEETVTIPVNLGGVDGRTIDKTVPIFRTGTPEEFIKWRMKIEETQRDGTYEWDEFRKLVEMLLRDKALTVFSTTWKLYESKNEKIEKPEDKMKPEHYFKAAMQELSRLFIPDGNAFETQVYHMEHELQWPKGESVNNFALRLQTLNSYLPYFPRSSAKAEKPHQLTPTQLSHILVRAAPLVWRATALYNGCALLTMTYEEITEKFRLYEMADSLVARERVIEEMTGRRALKHGNGNGPRPGAQSNGSTRFKQRKITSYLKREQKWCKFCRTPSHDTKDCWAKKTTRVGITDMMKRAERRDRDHQTAKKDDANKTISPKKYAGMLKKVNKAVAAKQGPPKPKRAVRMVLSDSDSDESMEDGELSEFELVDNEGTVDCNMRVSRPVNRKRSASHHSESAHALFDRQLNKKLKKKQYSPETIVEIHDKNGRRTPLRCLLDSGCSSSIILLKHLPKGTVLRKPTRPTEWRTLAGNYTTLHKATVEFKLVEFSTDRRIRWKFHVDACTDPEKSQYDIILGNDILHPLGINFLYSENRITWDGLEIPLRDQRVLHSSETVKALYQLALDATPTVQQAERRHATILDADYSAADINEYINQLEHLTISEKFKLRKALNRHTKLFQGGLGVLKVPPVRLELEKDAKPYHAKAYPIPHAFQHTTRKEIDRLTEIGVLERNSDSEWAAPTFVQPKKTGDVRVLTDFRRLNAFLRRKPYPLPRISDLLLQLEGFRYATALDLSMGYYHIPLDLYSQRLCTTVLPWGKYRYLRLPMGIKNSPDIFQNIMQDLLGDLPFVRVYIDDILIISNGDFDDHLDKLHQVLQRLEDVGFRANIRKCFFARDSLEYLGYTVTREGIKTQPKKIEAILNIAPPTTRKQLRRFLGMVNYYRDMWQRRSHILTPLTQYASDKIKFKWTPEMQAAFDEIKCVIARETMLAFPDFSKEFHIYTDASEYQLGAVIMQDDKPLAFYSRKLTPTQKNYTVGELELLSIVEALKEFRTILLKQKIVIHTDHKNLLSDTSSTPRLIRWRHLLEEYSPQWEYVKGENNVVADALSRLPIDTTQTANIENDEYDAYAFVTTEEIVDAQFPMSPKVLYHYQQKDKKILEAYNSQHKNIGECVIEGHNLITYKDKVYVPEPLRKRIAEWYHEYLCHPGQTRTEETIRLAFTWPTLRKTVKRYCRTCKLCQKNKKPVKKYGHLPPREPDTIPWSRVDVDLVGPYTVKTPTKTHVLRALTMIDPVTRWFEVTPIADTTAPTVTEAFRNTWLTRYPRPQYIGFDNGSEFKSVFRELIAHFGLQEKPSTEYNPQSNATVERVHHTLANALRTFELEELELDPDDPWGYFLSAAAWAIRSTYHTALNATPGQVVFGRDMILPIRFKANWALIAQRQQKNIQKNNTRENAQRLPHDYQPGDKVLLERPGIQRKLATPREGPYEVIRAYTNGTVRIQRGIVSQRVNIRRLTPYYEPSHLGSE